MDRTKPERPKGSTKDTVVTLVVIAFVVAVIVLAISLPDWALAVWAVAATLFLPLAGVLGWVLGNRDTTLTRQGIDLGIGSVITAAERTAEYRGKVGSDPEPIRRPASKWVATEPGSGQGSEEVPQVRFLPPSQSGGDDIFDM